MCGDSYLVFDTEQYKIFLLSDGMGYGEEAKERFSSDICDDFTQGHIQI